MHSDWRSNPEFTNIVEGLERFTRLVKKFDMTAGLEYCHNLANTLLNSNRPFIIIQGQAISWQFLAYLSKECLISSSDCNRGFCKEPQIVRLAEVFNSISDSIAIDRHDPNRSPLWEFYVKAHYEQIVWQQPIRYLLPRAYRMFSSHEQGDRKDARTRVAELFADAFGLDLAVYIQSGMAIYCRCMERPFVRYPFRIPTDWPRMISVLTPENLDKTSQHLYTDYRDFRQSQRKYIHTIPYERKYEFNFLRNRPIVGVKHGHCIAPIPHLIAEKLTNGIYYDLLDHANMTGGNAEAFTSLYGELFEEYVGNLLAEHYERGQELFRAAELFAESKHLRMCDWIVIDSVGVTLVECKSSRVPLDLVSSATPQAFADFMCDRYMKGGDTQFRAAYERFVRDGKEVYCLVVYNDSFPNFNGLSQFLSRDLISCIRQLKIQFVPIGEFEHFLPMLENRSISSVLKWKSADPNRFEIGFLESVSELPDYKKDSRNQYLESAWAEVFGKEIDA